MSEREIEATGVVRARQDLGRDRHHPRPVKRTVDFHIDNAREKLGVATRIEAVVKAASAGIIKP